MNPDQIEPIGLLSVGITGDAKKVAESTLPDLSEKAGGAGPEARRKTTFAVKSAWVR